MHTQECLLLVVALKPQTFIIACVFCTVFVPTMWAHTHTHAHTPHSPAQQPSTTTHLIVHSAPECTQCRACAAPVALLPALAPHAIPYAEESVPVIHTQLAAATRGGGRGRGRGVTCRAHT